MAGRGPSNLKFKKNQKVCQASLKYRAKIEKQRFQQNFHSYPSIQKSKKLKKWQKEMKI